MATYLIIVCIMFMVLNYLKYTCDDVLVVSDLVLMAILSILTPAGLIAGGAIILDILEEKGILKKITKFMGKELIKK